MLNQLLMYGIATGCIYALVAIGLSLIYNTTRILHIGHGAVYITGAYFLILFLVELKLSLTVSIALSFLCVGLLGWFMNFLVFEPLEKRKASPMIALLSSVGIYTIIINVISATFGNENKIIRSSIYKTYVFGEVFLSVYQILQIAVFVIIFPFILYFLHKTMWGRQVRAVRDNKQLALVMGIGVKQIRSSVFVVGSVLAGIAAILYALDVGVNPHMGMAMFLNGAVAMIIGGVGTFSGAVVGAFLISILQSLVIWQFSSRWVSAVTFALLIIFLIFKPEGIFGARKRIEEGVS